jgi:hypothetical protein
LYGSICADILEEQRQQGFSILNRGEELAPDHLDFLGSSA